MAAGATGEAGTNVVGMCPVLKEWLERACTETE